MIVAIIQARTSSSRLPKKVLKPILGKAMLIHQVDRIKRATNIDKIVVATSTDASDISLVSLCQSECIEVFTGDLDNVLQRFYDCAKHYHATHIVRLTADCPVIEPQVIDRAIDYYFAQGADYVATSEQFPDGLDTEILSFEVLEKMAKTVILPSEKEHVTYHIRQNPDDFNIQLLPSKAELGHLRLTVDEPEDFELITQIYQKLYPNNPNFTLSDILKLLKQHPELLLINNKFSRNEGLQKSLQQDKEFLKNVP